MFHMHDDVKILALSSVSALVAIVGALLLARWILTAIDRLHASSARLAAGDLTSRAPQEGVRELAELGSSFNQMAAAVEELFDARRQLVAWASHDLRTPLASINAMLEALEDGLVPLERYLPPLRDRVRTLSQLVDDLFELARIDAGALTIELTDAQIDQVVAGCLSGFEAQARLAQVSLEARLGEALPAVRCAPDKSRTCPPEPAHERLAPHPVGRDDRRSRQRTGSRSRGRRGGLRQRDRRRQRTKDLRALLARRPEPHLRRRRSRSGDRPRSHRGPGRAHLGREPTRRRRPLRLRPANRRLIASKVVNRY